MALKDRLRPQRSKRFSNVTDSDELEFSSSDSETGVKNKVRGGFSTKRLMKESECYTVDDDHIYTSNRKRKMSDDVSEKVVKKRCDSKNAVMARLNRERKKKYITSLETENESLRKENDEKTRKINEQTKVISSMRREIFYLKGLLANSKELGQILSQLKETTGLPVTSSMIQTKPGTQISSPVEHQPRTRSVHSGRNFPILHKDVNLGSCSEIEMADLENYPFDFETDCDLSNINEDDSFFNFNLDSNLEDSLKLNSCTKSDPQAGICLHLNQRRISLEFCSICNLKAGLQMEDVHDEVF